MKRLLSLAVGLGAGVVIGASVMRRIERARRAMTPASLAGRAGHAAGSLSDRVRAAVAEGRVAARAQERLLRQRYGVPTLRQALDAEPPR